MSTDTMLKFDLFQKYLSQAQRKMRDNEFCDVTLASADGQKFKAHKVILSASSHLFKNLLVNEKHSHPLIFMNGVQHEILQALVTFIYSGETQLKKDNVESFVKLITDIELFGVTEKIIDDARSKSKMEEKVQNKVCKHWNSGFCKQGHCKYLHSNEDCQIHLQGKECRDNKCMKRHRKTCRYWSKEGCERNNQCDFLHKETYLSRRRKSRSYRDQSLLNRGRSYTRERSLSTYEDRSISSSRRSSRERSSSRSKSRSKSRLSNY